MPLPNDHKWKYRFWFGAWRWVCLKCHQVEPSGVVGKVFSDGLFIPYSKIIRPEILRNLACKGMEHGEV